MDQDNSQQQLIELVVDKVLKKHGVIEQKPELNSEEKEKIASIVENIKADVENFLENSKQTKTEHDFVETTDATTKTVQPEVKRKKTFSNNNDLKAVKTFFPKNR